jgi:NADH-quinone oxidoreductase subunit M
MVSVLFWPLLSILVLVPFRKQSWAQWVNLLLHLPWVFFLIELIKVTPSGAPFGLMETYGTFPLFKSALVLGADTLNVSLIALTIFLSFSLSFYFLGHSKISQSFLILFQLLNFGTIGSLLAADAFLFYIFWEFMLIPLFFLIGIWGSENRVYAALKFFSMTLAGSLALLAGIFFIVTKTEVQSLAWSELSRNAEMLSVAAPWLGWAFLLAFLVKVPVWPLHTWLPDAHTEAPTGVSVMLAGILLKLGVYGMLRWVLQVFPTLYWNSTDLLFAASVIGIILGSYGALRQTDIKRMIAYSSVAHLGFVVLGATSTNATAQSGAFFQNFAHGLSTGLLFLSFGMIYDRTHSRKLDEYGGLASTNPFLAFTFVFASMASVALPGLPGFVGEFLILSGTFLQKGWWVLLPLMGVVLGAMYTLQLVKGLVFGKVSPLVESHPISLKWNEYVSIFPFLVGLALLGLAPQFLLAWINGSIPVK